MNDDNNANDVVTWDCAEADDFEATVWLRFRRQTDGMMLRFAAQSEQVELELGAQQGSLVLDSPNDHIRLDMEDTYGILLGGEHTVALTFGGFGIRVYLDGYQCFACATNLNPARFGERSAVRTNSGVYLLGVHSGAETSEQIAVQVAASVPDVEFAAATIADFDVERMEDVHNGTIFAHFRTRGIGQFGTVLAAAGDDGETMNVYVDDDGIRYTFRDGEQRYEYSARGSWTDGNWHDLVIRAFRGAIDLYVDGYLELHQPGQLFSMQCMACGRSALAQTPQGSDCAGKCAMVAYSPARSRMARSRRCLACRPQPIPRYSMLGMRVLRVTAYRQ
ncbi:LamG domain-containing protein [Bifidobacterium canis]|uniref:Laminin G domain-containing protein n=1 Tax=Bifidobacterium canis TaxID=2610880 RepID=A0A7K1J4P6_9BIFI|nr:LamG domain-containing protein [Bifidobacterium canis]MUH59521.1 hypothetical protein [Bifidobacterium canis]